MDHEMNSMAKSPHHSELEAQSKGERDAQVLARLGKKSVLQVLLGSYVMPNQALLNIASVDSASSRFADSLVPF